jgi:hypothetical protein
VDAALALSVGGQAAGFVGSLLLAYDLVRPRRPDLEEPAPLSKVLFDTLDALLLTEDDKRQAKLKGLHELAASCVLHQTSTDSRGSRIRGRLRRTGQAGVGLLAAGFALGLAGALIPTVPPTPSCNPDGGSFRG